MFSKLKQKIADGVEGVSPGKQTPLRGPTGEVGRAQAQNNGKIDESASPLSSLYSSPLHKQHEYNRRPSDLNEDENFPLQESTPNESFVASEPLSLSDRRISISSNAGVDERSDVESDIDSTIKFDQMNIHDLRIAFKKQNQILKKFKLKFSELVSAYKSMQKEKEKLEGALTNGQDKQLQRIKELKETIELEKEGKRHMEEVLNINLEEKDQQIYALRTQVDLLKSSLSERSTSFKDEKNLKKEKYTDSMQQNLLSKLASLQEELDKKDTIIIQIREESARNEASMREELLKEYKDSVLSVGLKKQEEELRMLYNEKELQIKDKFANKVHDLQRVLEENKKQRDLTLLEKDQELQKQKDLLQNAEQKINAFLKKEEDLRYKADGFNSKITEYQKKIEDLYLEIENEKKVSQNLARTFEEQMQEKQKDFNEQLAKKERLSQSKVYEIKEQLRRKSQDLSEAISSHKNELETIVKDTKQQMQSEHSKVVRKLELKISDMKKVMKELRAQLEEKELKCVSLAANLENEINFGKQLKLSSESLSNSLIESETKINELNQSVTLKDNQFQEEYSKKEFIKSEMLRMSQTIELMNIEQERKDSEFLDWRCKSEEASYKIEYLESQLRELQISFENKSLDFQDIIKSKDLKIEEINCKLKSTEKDLEDCISELQMERKLSEATKISIAEKETQLQQLSLDLNLGKEFLEENISLKKTNDFLNKDLDNLKIMCDEYKGDINKLKIMCDEYKGDNNKLKIMCDEYKGDINNLKIMCDKYKEDINNLKIMCDEYKEDIDNLKIMCDEYKGDNNKLKIMCDEYKGGNTELNLFVSRKEIEIELQKNEILVLNEELKCLKDSNQFYEATIFDYKTELERLKQLQVQHDKCIDEKNIENESFKSQVEVLKTEIDLLKKKSYQLEAEISAKNEDLNLSKSAISSYEKLIEEKEKEFRIQVNSLMEDKNISVAHYSEKMEEVRKSSILELESRYKQKIKDLSKGYDAKINTMHENFEKNEQTLTIEYKNQLNKLESKIETFQAQQNKRRKFLAKITNDLQNTNTWLDANMHDNCKIDLYDDNTENNYLKSDEKVLRRQLIDIVKQNRNKIEELVVKKSSYYHNYIKCSDEREKLLKELELLSAQLDEKCSDEREKLLKELELLSAQLCENTTLLSEKEIFISNLNKKISFQEKDDLEKYNQYQYQNNLLKAEIEKLESVNLSLLESVNNCQRDLLAKTKDVQLLTQSYEEKLSCYSSENEQLLCHISLLKNENEKLNDNSLLNTKLEAELSNALKIQEDLGLKINTNNATIEELKLEILKYQSSNNDLDKKIKSLLDENTNLHAMLKLNEIEYNEKYERLEKEYTGVKENLERNIKEYTDIKENLERNIEEIELSNIKNIESLRKENLGELMLELSKNNDLNKTKLLDIKQKAELKIKKIKREFSEKIVQKESRIKELESLLNVQQLEVCRKEEANITLLTEQYNLEKIKITEQLVHNHGIELETSCKKFVEEIDFLKKLLNEKNAELLIEKDRVIQLQESIEQMTIDKMSALKKQKLYLEEDHQAELKKVIADAQQKTEMIEKKLTAKIEEKDFEFNSKVKQMLKEFRLEQCQKDHSIDQAVQEAIEKAQCHERKIIMEYDEQINELKKELFLREDDLINFQNEANDKISSLTEANVKLAEEHQVLLKNMEVAYNERLESIIKSHKEELQSLTDNHKTQEEMEILFKQQTQVLIDEYEKKLINVQESHHAEMLSQEKKLKSLAKKNKLEMRKLLNEKNDLQNDTSSEKISDLTKELVSLREKEKVLAMQVEESSPVSPDKFRPATLVLDQNISNSQSSSPRTPQPIEFEYLRNILFQYMMGKQRTQMAKVLTAIVHFSPTQVKQILAKVEEQENQNVKKSSGWL
ncbi:golgin subfamily A member 4 isoform X2 [Hydra vulgaris]|uniref:golgin subfamily A member 4 isoform X2 n=1 Tax=Hydra vulgaris TaxID=6087 RepID=UPI001F5E7B73|nr:golgin subfamily A member 4 isoform X2 [Hydra vulgaris]